MEPIIGSTFRMAFVNLARVRALAARSRWGRFSSDVLPTANLGS